ncbi:MAG TPA: hypothetical protein VHZ03_08275 [Trebonia sp.]|jgi:hypothetical protein|nr:hypothetical protein [Trebonia sp.]
MTKFKPCGTTAELTNDEIVTIVRDGFARSGDDGIDGFHLHASCELSTGHGRAHAAFVASMGKTEAWLHWGEHRAVKWDSGEHSCEALAPEDHCALFAGHEGDHHPMDEWFLAPSPE